MDQLLSCKIKEHLGEQSSKHKQFSLAFVSGQNSSIYFSSCKLAERPHAKPFLVIIEYNNFFFVVTWDIVVIVHRNDNSVSRNISSQSETENNVNELRKISG